MPAYELRVVVGLSIVVTIFKATIELHTVSLGLAYSIILKVFATQGRFLVALELNEVSPIKLTR